MSFETSMRLAVVYDGKVVQETSNVKESEDNADFESDKDEG